MARTLQLSEIRTAVRRRADMEGSNFVTDAEIDTYINASAAELWDLLVEANGLFYYAVEATINTTAAQKTSALPTTFYKLARMEVTITGDILPIRRMNWPEGWKAGNVSTGWTRGVEIRCALAAGAVYWFPTPQAVHTVTYWYIPYHTKMTSDTDTFDGVNGWEEYIVVDAAMKCLVKEESDTGALAAAKAQLAERISKIAEEVDYDNPTTVVDTAGSDFGFDIHPADFWR